MSKPLHRCLAKGTKAEGDLLQYGPNWTLSRRALLCVFNDHLKCGDWFIPYDEIELGAAAPRLAQKAQGLGL